MIRLIVAFFLGSCCWSLSAQVVLPSVYAQDWASSLNPAHRNQDSTLSDFGITQRQLWLGNKNSPLSSILNWSWKNKSAQFGAKFERFSFGFYAFNDIRLTYSYAFQINTNAQISFGLDVGTQQIQPKNRTIRVWDSGDHLFQNRSFNRTLSALYTGFGGEILWNNWTLGWSYPMANFYPVNINGDQVYSQLLIPFDPRKYVTGSYVQPLANHKQIRAAFFVGKLLDTKAISYTEWQATICMELQKMDYGFGLRSNGGVFLKAKFKLTDGWIIHYSGNVLSIKNPQLGLGNHELGIYFSFQ